VGVATYKLKTPVQIAGTTIAELSFRPARAKDFRRMPANEEKLTIGNFLDLAASLCEQPPAVIDQLEPEDMQGVMEIVAGFFEGSRLTGA
jgi:hypothetical protein